MNYLKTILTLVERYGIMVILLSLGVAFFFYTFASLNIARAFKHNDLLAKDTLKDYYKEDNNKFELKDTVIIFFSFSIMSFVFFFAMYFHGDLIKVILSIFYVIYISILIYLFQYSFRLDTSDSSSTSTDSGNFSINLNMSNINVIISTLLVGSVMWDYLIIKIISMIVIVIFIIITLLASFLFKKKNHKLITSISYLMLFLLLFIGLTTNKYIGCNIKIFIIFFIWIGYLILDFLVFKKQHSIYNPYIFLNNTISIMIGIVELFKLNQVNLIYLISILCIMFLVSIIYLCIGVFIVKVDIEITAPYITSLKIGCIIFTVSTFKLFNTIPFLSNFVIIFGVILSIVITLFNAKKVNDGSDNVFINLINILLTISLISNNAIIVIVLLFTFFGILLIRKRAINFLK